MIHWYEQYKNSDIVKSKKMNMLFLKVDKLFESGKVKWDLQEPENVIAFIENFCKHVKDTWTGKLITLELWQKSFITLLYGVVCSETNLRYFKEAFLLVARKSGKSTLIAALGLYDFLFNNGSEVLLAANTRDQSEIVFSAAVAMVNLNSDIAALTTKKRTELVTKNGINKLFRISGDSKGQDGYNPSTIIFDEIHAAKNEDMYNVLKSSQGARKERLFINITTAGFERDSIYDKLYNKSEIILKDDNKELNGFLPLLYEIDSKEEFDDEKNWIKANPNLGVSNELAFLKNELDDAQYSESAMNNFLTKYCNIPRSATSAFIYADELRKKCSGTFEYEKFRGKNVFIGIDLSRGDDLTSITFLFFNNDEDKIYIKNEVFMTLKMIEKGVAQGIPYNIWLKKGLINTTKKDLIDIREVSDFIIMMIKKYNLKVIDIGYDKYEAHLLVEHLHAKGFKGQVLPQQIQHMSEPTKEFKKYLDFGWLNYDDNPIVEWTYSNVRIWDDGMGNIRVKKDPDHKLKNDPFISSLNAFRIYRSWKEKTIANKENMLQWIEIMKGDE